MQVNARDLLITNATLITFKYLLGIARWWVIKSIPRTRARNISEFFAIACQFALDVASLPVLILLWTSELEIQRRRPGISDADLLTEALTPKFQKVQAAVCVATTYLLIGCLWGGLIYIAGRRRLLARGCCGFHVHLGDVDAQGRLLGLVL